MLSQMALTDRLWTSWQNYLQIRSKLLQNISKMYTKNAKIVISQKVAEATDFAESCVFHGTRCIHVIAK